MFNEAFWFFYFVDDEGVQDTLTKLKQVVDAKLDEHLPQDEETN